MPKVKRHPAVLAAAHTAAAATAQRAELQLGFGRCGWLQSEPASGRVLLYRLAGERPLALTPNGFSVRSGVHEYGGGSWCPGERGAWFVNECDQGIYLQPWCGGPPQLWWRRPGCRYGDLTLDAAHRRLLLVEEQHPIADDGPAPNTSHPVTNRLLLVEEQQHSDADDGPDGDTSHPVTNRLLVEEQQHSDADDGPDGDTSHPVTNRLLVEEQQHSELDAGPAPNASPPVTNRLVAIALDRCRRRVLAEGEDFYAAPAAAPDGRALAWISWDHPFQPWLGTRLNRASLDPSGVPQRVRRLLNGCRADRPEALQQPRFSPDGRLWVISDRSGWWNLYRFQQEGWQPMLPLAAEFGGAPWQLGGRSYAFVGAKRVVCSLLQQGVYRWGVLTLGSAGWQLLAGEWGDLAGIGSDGAAAYALAADSRRSGLLLCARAESESASESEWTVSRRLDGLGGATTAAESAPQACCFRGDDGEAVHGFYYAPASSSLPATGTAARLSGRLLVQLHGGPTAYRAAVVDSQRRFWQDQGYGVLELNYRGSSGYGRAYRQRLQQQWGEIDAADACAAGRYALARGWAQPGGLAVRGNSSGGYTLLRALQRADNPFSAAGCHYGIGDLARLAALTHKFESRYLDWLIGDPAGEAERYRQRSPVAQPATLCTPVIFFQGAEDRVVPPEQTRRMFAALQAQGIASEYVEFAGEGHGFRRAANRAEVLYREWWFYQRQLVVVSEAG